MAKLIDIFTQDVQKALTELQDTEKLLKYLSGEHTPKLDRRYILYVKKFAGGSETFVNVSFFSKLPRNIYVSEDTPIILYSQTAEYDKTYKLVPAEEEYLIFNPGGTYKFKIKGERDYGEIVITTNQEFYITDACFDMRALKHFSEHLPYKLYDTFTSATRGVIKKKFAGIDVTFDDLLNELSRTLAKSFLSFYYLTKIWPKAIVCEDISMLKSNVEVQTKTVTLEQINKNFEKLLRAIKKVKLLQN